jgi:uncharacterized protein YecE (DUF72 family)
MKVLIGCAGWSIPKEHAALFRAAGSHLERYAGRFPAVEINSSFYRPHQPKTYARWAASVPASFRFAVKVPRTITHERRLAEVEDLLEPFLAQVAELGDRLGPLLVQLPPSLAFNPGVVRRFWMVLRQRFDGEVACEPRHATWFRPAVGQLLADFRVARVAADPAVVPAAAEPGGWDGLVYYRLHGSPQMYYSSYSAAYLDALRQKLDRAAPAASRWCIFDNTALGAATANGLDLVTRLSDRPRFP